MSGMSVVRATRVGLVTASVALALAIQPPPARAINADPSPHVFVQPDGTRLTLYLRGDEWMHWQEDDRGHAVVQDGATWRYAKLADDGTLVATPYAVGSIVPETVGLRTGIHPVLDAASRLARAAALTPARGAGHANTSPVGTVKNLVVLCLFSDQTVAANGRAPSAYDSLFNGVNSSGFNAPTGSVRDYYYQASFGTMTLQSTVIAWVTLPHTEAYYANGRYGVPFGFAKNGNTAAPYPTNACGMVHDALALVDGLVNFADFDQNNDGYVDAIDFIHSGYGGEQNGNTNNQIWSHKYSLSGTNGGGVWTSADQNANHVNVKVDLYHTEPALWGSSGSALVRVGVIAHETGHFFGLPDLYDLDGSSQGIGNWCLMANSWGWDGTQLYPPLFSAWCRIQLGWVSPEVVSGPAGYSLAKVETSGNILRISTDMPTGEYLLIENREPWGFDQQIPQGGIAIWHIDDNVGSNSVEGYPGQSGWPQNGNHYKVALIPADSMYNLEKPYTRTFPTPPDSGNNGDIGDLFRSSRRWHVNEATLPNTDSYVGLMNPTGIDIQVMSDPGENMTVWVRPGYWVDFSAVGPELGAFLWPYHSLATAISATPAEGGIVCKGGTTGERPTITKALSIRSWGGVTTIGP
jgi:M6 family metalloprotease-like protein